MKMHQLSNASCMSSKTTINYVSYLKMCSSNSDTREAKGYYN
jgi:hypothetical protein